MPGSGTAVTMSWVPVNVSVSVTPEPRVAFVVLNVTVPGVRTPAVIRVYVSPAWIV